MRLAADVDWQAIATPARQSLKAGESLNLVSDLKDYSELEINYNFTSEKATSQLILEYEKDGEWQTLNNHDYHYVLQAGKKYAAFAKVKKTDVPKLHLRLRNAGKSPMRFSMLKIKQRPRL